MSARDRPGLDPLGTARRRLLGASDYPFDRLAALRRQDVGEETLFLAWEATRWAQAGSDAERLRVLDLVLAALVAERQGSTRVAVDEEARALLARLPALAGGPDDRRPFVVDAGFLYPRRLHHVERRLAAHVAARAGAPSPFAPDAVAAAVADVVASAVPAPSDEQAGALRTALGRRLTVLAGGPGTGKTSVVVTLLRALVRLGLPPEAIAVAAPTGKAANRLDESVRKGLAALAAPRSPADLSLRAAAPAPQTLHRLLGYAPGSDTFLHHDGNPLSARAVIVDEGSMIDLFVMERLLRALRDDAVLVLLGDADQLPSVDTGAVFRDLAALPTLATRLRHSYRMDPGDPAGRRIYELAQRVKDGDAAALPAAIDARADAADLRWHGVESVRREERHAAVARFVAERVRGGPDFERLAGEPFTLGAGGRIGDGGRARDGGDTGDGGRARDGGDTGDSGRTRDGGRIGDGGRSPDGAYLDDEARLDALFRCVGGARILCVTRATPGTGADVVNAEIRRRAGPGDDFLPGEPVMLLRNDYARSLWNGDQGLIVDVREPGRRPRRMAVFPSPSGWSPWELDSFGGALTRAYALTVHKAQGSELDDVLFLLPDEDLPLFTREIVYTALTRSRRSVVIAGEAAVLAAGVLRPVARSSGLADALRPAAAKP